MVYQEKYACRRSFVPVLLQQYHPVPYVSAATPVLKDNVTSHPTIPNPEAMQQPFNSFGYPQYMQGGYPVNTFPSGQPGMPMNMPMNMPMQPMATPPSQPTSPEPALTPAAQVGHVTDRAANSVERDVPTTVVPIH
eukprot:1102897-Rhodomonas_salina.1